MRQSRATPPASASHAPDQAGPIPSPLFLPPDPVLPSLPIPAPPSAAPSPPPPFPAPGPAFEASRTLLDAGLEGSLLALMHVEREKRAREFGREMAAAFHRLHREGRCCRHKALVTLRMWRREAGARGCDVSWGASEEVGVALGVSEEELGEGGGQDAKAMGWDVMETEGEAQGNPGRSRLAAAADVHVRELEKKEGGQGPVCAWIEGLATFQALDDGEGVWEEGAGLFSPAGEGPGGDHVGFWSRLHSKRSQVDGSTALLFSLFDGRRQLCALGRHFERNFLTRAEWEGLMTSGPPVLLPYLVASLVVGGDREDFFDVVADLYFGKALQASALLKVFDKDMRPFLAVLRLALLPPTEEGAGLVEVLTLRRSPCSKHLREQPGQRGGGSPSPGLASALLVASTQRPGDWGADGSSSTGEDTAKRKGGGRGSKGKATASRGRGEGRGKSGEGEWTDAKKQRRMRALPGPAGSVPPSGPPPGPSYHIHHPPHLTPYGNLPLPPSLPSSLLLPPPGPLPPRGQHPSMQPPLFPPPHLPPPPPPPPPPYPYNPHLSRYPDPAHPLPAPPFVRPFYAPHPPSSLPSDPPQHHHLHLARGPPPPPPSIPLVGSAHPSHSPPASSPRFFPPLPERLSQDVGPDASAHHSPLQAQPLLPTGSGIKTPTFLSSPTASRTMSTASPVSPLDQGISPRASSPYIAPPSPPSSDFLLQPTSLVGRSPAQAKHHASSASPAVTAGQGEERRIGGQEGDKDGGGDDRGEAHAPGSPGESSPLYALMAAAAALTQGAV